MQVPKIGDMVKVNLPGESPWAECTFVNDDETWLGRIDNRLTTDWSAEENLNFVQSYFGTASQPLKAIHDYHLNDVVNFCQRPLTDGDDTWIWVPNERGSANRRRSDRRKLH